MALLHDPKLDLPLPCVTTPGSPAAAAAQSIARIRP